MTDNILHQARAEAERWYWLKKLYLAPKGFTFNYVRYRILRPVLKGYYKLFNLFHPKSPWTTPASILFFKKVLTKDMTGLEYGSGRSTLFFAKRLKKLVSIEHHPEWYQKVSKMLKEHEIENVEYILIPEQKKSEGEETALRAKLEKLTGDESREEFADYYNKANDYPDGYFDFVLIDGRARVKCGLIAMKKLKSGGIFVLDNSERARYKPLQRALVTWPKTETTTGLTNTTIWIKP